MSNSAIFMWKPSEDNYLFFLSFFDEGGYAILNQSSSWLIQTLLKTSENNYMDFCHEFI